MYCFSVSVKCLYEKAFAYRFSGQEEKIADLLEEHGFDRQDKNVVFGDSTSNTSIANYVWLPLRFVEANEEHPNGMVYIDWLDEWKLDDYE